MGCINGFDDLKTNVFQIFDDKNPNEFFVLRNKDDVTHVEWLIEEPIL